MALNLQNAFSGSVINLDKLAEAKKNEYDSRVKALSGLDSTLAQLQRAKKSQEIEKEFKQAIGNYEGIQKSVAEDEQWLRDNPKQELKMDAVSVGAVANPSGEPTELDKYNDLEQQREERLHNLKVNKQYLADKKAEYDAAMEQMGWMKSPAFHQANAEYIRTGNSNILTGMQQAYQQKLFQERQLAQQKAEKEAAEQAEAVKAGQAKDAEANKTFDEAMNLVTTIKGKDGKKLSSDMVSTYQKDVLNAISALKRGGYDDLAEKIESAYGAKVSEGAGNDAADKAAYEERKNKLTEEYNKLPKRKRDNITLEEFIRKNGKIE